MTWVGIDLQIPNHINQLFGMIRENLLGARRKRAKDLFWHATCWTVWINRNHIVFNQKHIDDFDFLSQIKLVSWNWWMYRRERFGGVAFSDWCINPWDCVLNK